LYCWDGSDIVTEQADGSKIKTYLRGINLFAREIDSMVYYYIFNEHGDVNQLWSQSGVCNASYEYDAFGVERNLDKEDENPFRYCGEYYDLGSSTYYLRARDYRPATGRFISEDTLHCAKNQLPNEREVLDPLSLNLYTYVYNNPLYYQDPDGHFVISTIALVAIGLAAVGAVIGGFIGNHIANNVNVASQDRWKYIAGGAVGGAVIGAAAGYLVGPSIATATGIGGISVTSAGISTVTSGTVGATGFEQARQLVQASSQIDSSPTFTSNSYNVSELFKTQADSITRATGASVEAIKKTILEQGAHTIEPIKIFVRDGMAMIVDGHHRYQAFVELGLSRIPIQYIHENQLKLYTAYDTAKKMLEAAYK